MMNWDLCVRFDKRPKAPHATGNFVGVAFTDTEIMYKAATIVYVRTDLVTDSTIIHELLHCLVGQLTGYLHANTDPKKNKKPSHKAWSTYFEEQTVSELERIICRLALEPKK